MMAERGEIAPVGLGPGDGSTVSNPMGGPLTFKLRGSDSGGSLLVFQSEVEAGEGPPLHTHAGQDETLYVLEGEFRFKFGDKLRAAPAGSFMFVPSEAPHTWQNVGPGLGRLLVTFTPAGRMDEFFERFAALDHAGPEEFASLGAEAGMNVVGPPLAVSDPI